MDKIKKLLSLSEVKFFVIVVVSLFMFFSGMIYSYPILVENIFFVLFLISFGSLFYFTFYKSDNFSFYLVAFSCILFFGSFFQSFYYIYNKIKDPCYRKEKIIYMEKGPWEYYIGDRKCVGKDNGTSVIFRTEK